MSGKRVNGNDPSNQARRRASGQSPYSSSNSRSRPPQRSNDPRSRSASSHSGGDRTRQPSNGSRSNPNRPPANNRHRRLRKRKKSRALRVLLIVLAILLAICVAVYAFVQGELGKIGRLGITKFTSEDFEQDGSGADTIEAVDWGEADIATSVEGVVNVLLVGQDTRNPEQRARSDSMIVLSINKNTNQLTMVSLMRDLYVKIPGYSDNKLNAAYAFGGFELLDETIAANFGIQIDYNVEVNFGGFKDIIDTVGGIDIELNEAEAEYMNSPDFVDDMGAKLERQLSPGLNHLNGQEALCYARIRHVGNSDWERTDRQRKVIQTVYSQIREENWTKLLDIYSSVADDLTTDMNNTQIISIAFSAYSMGLESINSYRVPADHMYTNERINGMDILVPKDWDTTRSLVKEYLYSEDSGASAEAAAQQAYSTNSASSTTTTTGTTTTVTN